MNPVNLSDCNVSAHRAVCLCREEDLRSELGVRHWECSRGADLIVPEAK